MSEALPTPARKHVRRDGSLILEFGEVLSTGPHQQFDFYGSEPLADAVVERFNSHASQISRIEELEKALKNSADALTYCLSGLATDPLKPKVEATLKAARLALGEQSNG